MYLDKEQNFTSTEGLSRCNVQDIIRLRLDLKQMRADRENTLGLSARLLKNHRIFRPPAHIKVPESEIRHEKGLAQSSQRVNPAIWIVYR